MYRKYPLVNDAVYHVFNKSIAGFRILNHDCDYQRLIKLIKYFSLQQHPVKFSKFYEKTHGKENKFDEEVNNLANQFGYQVQVIAFCLMPTHLHLAVKQITTNGISDFLRKTLNSYSHYFNIKYKRKGPLWTGPFKNVEIENDEQLLHVTRYIHLNPVTDNLVKKPEQWAYSSYQEYIARQKVDFPITVSEGLINISSKEYESFCNDHITYQKELALIKHQVIE